MSVLGSSAKPHAADPALCALANRAGGIETMRCRGELDPVQVDDWLAQLDGDRRRVEAVLNHVHLWDEISGDAQEEKLLQVARALACTWSARLATLFPDRRFVDVSRTAEDSGPTMYMHQVG